MHPLPTWYPLLQREIYKNGSRTGCTNHVGPAVQPLTRRFNSWSVRGASDGPNRGRNGPLVRPWDLLRSQRVMDRRSDRPTDTPTLDRRFNTWNESLVRTYARRRSLHSKCRSAPRAGWPDQWFKWVSQTRQPAVSTLGQLAVQTMMDRRSNPLTGGPTHGPFTGHPTVQTAVQTDPWSDRGTPGGLGDL